jgi:hypothetical protein
MESDHREDQHTSEPQATERSESNTDRAAFTVPFASEGLERVRDTHC